MSTNPQHRAPRAAALAAAALAALLALAPAPAAPAPAAAEESVFSFFGVRFGMTRAEVDQKWHALSGGVYAVSSPAVRQVRPSFNHEGRLYEMTFSVDLQLPDDPPALVSQAFQDALNAFWKRKDAGLIVTLSASRDGNSVTIVSEKLRDAYLRHLQEKIAALLQP